MAGRSIRPLDMRPALLRAAIFAGSFLAVNLASNLLAVLSTGIPAGNTIVDMLVFQGPTYSITFLLCAVGAFVAQRSVRSLAFALGRISLFGALFAILTGLAFYWPHPLSGWQYLSAWLLLGAVALTLAAGHRGPVEPTHV